MLNGTEVSKPTEDPKPLSYPCIKIGVITGTVILFLSPRRGVVLVGGRSNKAVGYYSEDFYENNFVPFYGVLEIEQERE